MLAVEVAGEVPQIKPLLGGVLGRSRKRLAYLGGELVVLPAPA